MSKRSHESLLIDTLAEGYTITAACKRAGVSRMFYNRHYKNDRDFRIKANRAMTLGKQTNDDRAISVLMKKINDQDWRPTRYYLEHNVAPYKKQLHSHSVALPELHPERVKLSDAEAYEQFVLWTALTPEERRWRNIETRGQFCKTYGIPDIRLLDVWTRREGFETRVSALREEWILSKTGEVLGEVYAAARSGDPRSQRLWLENAYHVKEKRDADAPNRVVITPEDIRSMFDFMPEDVQQRNNERLKAILADAVETEKTLKEKERREIEANEPDTLAPFISPTGEIDWLGYSETL